MKTLVHSPFDHTFPWLCLAAEPRSLRPVRLQDRRHRLPCAPHHHHSPEHENPAS